MGKNILLCSLLFLSLFASLSYSTAPKDSGVIFSFSHGEINVSVLTTDRGEIKLRDYEANKEFFNTFFTTGFDEGGAVTPIPDTASLEDKGYLEEAKVKIFYEKSGQWTQKNLNQKCKEIQISNFFGTCELKEEIYEQKCINLKIEYAGEKDKIASSVTYATVCDTTHGIFPVLGSAINKNLDQNDPMCVLTTLLLGLLLASMFFTGRSPLSLLDITTPMLPRPKGFAFRSFSFGGGFWKMKQELLAQQKMFKKSFKESVKVLGERLKKLNPANTAFINSILRSTASIRTKALALALMEKGANKKSVMKIIATDDEKIAKKWGLSKDEREKTLRDAVFRLKEIEGKKRGLGEFIDLSLRNEMLVAEMPSGPKWFNKSIGKVVGFIPGVNRIAMVGAASITGTLRNMRSIARATAGLPVAVGDSLTEGAVQRRIGLAREKKGAKGKLAKGAYGFFYPEHIEKAEKLWDTLPREARMYKELMKSAKNDLKAYYITQILKKKGINLSISYDELMTLLFDEDIDTKSTKKLNDTEKQQLIDKLNVLKALGIEGVNPAELLEIDRKIRNILTDKKLGDWDRITELAKLANQYGAYGDIRALGAMKTLKAFEADKRADSEKLQDFMTYLKNTYRVDKPVNSITDLAGATGRKFYFMTGRDSLVYGNGTSDIFRYYVLHSYIQEVEKGKASNKHYALERPSNGNFLVDVVKLNTVKLFNQKWGFPDPTDPRLKNDRFKTAMFQMKLMLNDFIDVDKLERFLGKKTDVAVLNPTDYLYSQKIGKRITSYQEIKEEYGPDDVWKLDVKHFWNVGTKGSRKTAEHEAYGRVHLAHIHSPEPVRVVAHKYMHTRMKSMIGERSPNAIFFSNSEYRSLKEIRMAYMDRILEYRGEDPTKFSMDQKLQMVSYKNIKDFTQKTISLAEMKKYTWVRTKEGQLIPFRDNMSFSDAERIVNGRLTYRTRNNRWAPMELEKVNLISLPKKYFDQMGKVSTIQDYSTLYGDLKGWADKHGNKEKLLMLAALKQTATTKLGQPDLFWQSTVQNKDVKVNPYNERAPGMKGLWDRVIQGVSQGIETTLISAALPQLKKMYETTALSEDYRQRVSRMSQEIISGKAKARNPEAMKFYEQFIDSTIRYHTAWDNAITRDPRGNSSDIGHQFIFASFFHHGPAVPFESSFDTNFYYGKRRKAVMDLLMNPIRINWAIGGAFASAYRTHLTSRWGYPHKYDRTEDPLEPYAMTPPRTRDAVTSLLNPLFAGVDLFSASAKGFAYRLGNVIGAGSGPLTRKLGLAEGVMPKKTARTPGFMKESLLRELFGGDATRTGYAGDESRMGIHRSHEDTSWIHKNINIIHGNTNPGASYESWRRTAHMDPRLAVHLTKGSKYASYYSKDTYLQKQASLGIVKREITAERLWEKREAQLRSYGARQNTLFGFLNPFMFAVHTPLIPLISTTGILKGGERAAKFIATDQLSRREKWKYVKGLRMVPAAWLARKTYETGKRELRQTFAFTSVQRRLVFDPVTGKLIKPDNYSA
ncbi:hypothetical protein KAW38_03755 [Candidatus Micrarchaeota archaeon]|nr:hypothetical protein [Candidatus Micrarchaeota archaeon]